MTSVKFLNLLVIYSVLTKITATENSFPKFAETSIYGIENVKYVPGQTERPYLDEFRKKYPHLFSPYNRTMFSNNNYLGSVYPNENSDVLNTRNTVTEPSDFKTYYLSPKQTYTTYRIYIPIGLISIVIIGCCRCCAICCEKERSVEVPESVCSKDQEDNFIYVPENVIILPQPPIRQDGQELSADNGNGTEAPPPAYSDAMVHHPPPTYEEITEKGNNSNKN